ncbi:hypothetical protein [Levilactobacillus sp. HBUAS70063]|uniref:hypothetical protein n=1 Tax=Levilactobacillus sp. HBUAS70063 TaxID=3109359 RepID=UPI003133385C
MNRDSINQLIVDLIATHYAQDDAAFDAIVLELLRGLNAETALNSQVSAVRLHKLIAHHSLATTGASPAKNLSVRAAIDPKMFRLEHVRGNLATTAMSPDTRARLVKLFPHDSVNLRGRYLLSGTGQLPITLAKLIAGGSLRQVLTMDVVSSLREFTKSGGGDSLCSPTLFSMPANKGLPWLHPIFLTWKVPISL